MLSISSTNTVTLTGWLDNNTGNYVNNGTVTCVVRDTAGTTVVSSFALDYVASSDGIYKGSIDEAVAFTNNKPYELTVTMVQGSNQKTIKQIHVAEYSN